MSKGANYVSIASDKKQSTCLLLCLFTGIFGFHYFYVRRYMRGLMCMFTANFFLFGWFADIVKLISGNFVDSDGQKVRR